MGQQVDLTLSDDEATPAGHVFKARGASPALAVYEEVTAGPRIGWARFTASVKESGQGAAGKTVVDLRIAIPALETISGDSSGYVAIPKVAFTDWMTVTLTSPNRSTRQRRANVLSYIRDALGESHVQEMLLDLDRAH
jgi:hypothetical protein